MKKVINYCRASVDIEGVDTEVHDSVEVEIGRKYYRKVIHCFYHLVIPKDEEHAYALTIHNNSLYVNDNDNVIDNWASWIKEGKEISEAEFFEAYEEVSKILPIKQIVD